MRAIWDQRKEPVIPKRLVGLWSVDESGQEWNTIEGSPTLHEDPNRLWMIEAVVDRNPEESRVEEKTANWR